MLLDAIHLTPDSETVAWMKENALTDDVWGNPTEYTPKLYDMSGHWLTEPGVAGRGAVLRHGGAG